MGAQIIVLLSSLKSCLRNYQTRKALRNNLHAMNSQELDALVRDIGISSCELYEEASRPFWRSDVHKHRAKPNESGLKNKIAAFTQYVRPGPI